MRAATAIAFSASSDLKLPVSPASTPAMYSSIGISAVMSRWPSLGANLDREVGTQRRLASSVHLIGAADAQFADRQTCLRQSGSDDPDGMQRQRRDSRWLAGCTFSQLRLTAIGAEPQLARRMQIPEAHANGLRKPACG